MSNINEADRPSAMKPFPYTAHTAQGQRPRRRAGSDSSDSSASSAMSAASIESQDQFVFSPHRTPASEKEPFFSHHEYSGVHRPRTDDILPQPPQTTSAPRRHSETADSTILCSRPIEIQLPSSVSKRSKGSTAYTPIAPLSARGDIPGGYFPFHEDPEVRIYRPHPFHAAEKEARRDCDVESLLRIGSIQATPSPPTPPAPGGLSASPVHIPMLRAVEMPSSRGHTPVTSYVPSGLHGAPLPVGKYYPSNYEQRKKQTHHSSKGSMRPPTTGGPLSVNSDTVVPQTNRSNSHGSAESSRFNIQQYKRDMIMQVQLAKQRLESGGATTAPSETGSHGAPLQRSHGSSFARGPISPRLQPQGSPGPVTPLALEGTDGYLAARNRDRPRPVPSPDAGLESHAVAKAMKAHGERRHREGRGSPAVEAGGFGF